MRAHVAYADLQCFGCTALCNITRGDKIIHEDAFDAVMTAMEAHKLDVSVQKPALAAMRLMVAAMFQGGHGARGALPGVA